MRSDGRSAEDHGADAGRRRALRHDGSEAYGDDGQDRGQRAVPLLPQWQPHGHVRRSTDLLRRRHDVSTRPRDKYPLSIAPGGVTVPSLDAPFRAHSSTASALVEFGREVVLAGLVEEC